MADANRNWLDLSFYQYLFLSSQQLSFVIRVAHLLSSQWPTILSYQCFFFLSSQCVTLGSRCKNIYTLGSEQHILGTYIKGNIHGEDKMDPSVTHWDDSIHLDTGIPFKLVICL
ncbi:hypothetical protein [Wolbachia endosymbiont of Folsomia candida]|uniref:hypothetical protein n=1 Tax=Wolbachia endosymbiont of Folsomia candida TaxID=169402 RepID=UPI00138FD6A2|nr:hypothetical protein [Wolbachia endosymbiont of Folsomia candida]